MVWPICGAIHYGCRRAIAAKVARVRRSECGVTGGSEDFCNVSARQRDLSLIWIRARVARLWASRCDRSNIFRVEQTASA